MSAPAPLLRRLLDDIAEIQQEPYPNVHFHIDEADITKACLILTPERAGPLHLKIVFPADYPLRAPEVTIQSDVEHPNVFSSGYICASILNTDEGWTAAYTLKGVIIQLLSFFSSDKIEQEYGGVVDLNTYGNDLDDYSYYNQDAPVFHRCHICGFNEHWKPPERTEAKNTSSRHLQLINALNGRDRSKLFELPDEVVLHLMDYLDTTDLMALANAIPSIKRMLNSFDFIRIRELKCYVLKKSFMKTKLGVGVSVTGSKRPVFHSEFDLLSNEAYNLFHIRKSVQGVTFHKWLPLPLSRRHWNTVKVNAGHCLLGLHRAAKMQGDNFVDVLYYFMNNIVVQFSNDATRSYNQLDARSTLTHASEKAVEAYFALFHLLLCFATENYSIVLSANDMVRKFLAGPRTKTHFPDLGHLLVAALISDDGLTQELAFHIIKEAVLRNVVWMLDTKGAGMAELAYLEPNSVSDYRLTKTFEASLTSYRLLMFLKLFGSTARVPGKSLVQLRDELFDTHSAPPNGISAIMAQKIRQIRDLDSFPKFFTAMGIREIPSKSEFSAFLKRTITDSVEAGYSTISLTQSQLYMIRRKYDPGVGVSKEVEITPEVEAWYNRGEKWYDNGWKGRASFFPVPCGPWTEALRRAAGGRGRNRGRGRGY